MSDNSYASLVSAAERLLKYKFRDDRTILRALTHPSYNDEPGASSDYERLEFLGDAVLSMIIVDEIYHRFPEMSEGDMTKVKIAVVSGTTLTQVAEKLGLANLLIVGESEKGTLGRGLASALENVFEAIVGALYLDGGLEAARAFVIRVLGDRIHPETAQGLEHPKSLLQELVQARGLTLIYEITGESGPPHDRSFTSRVIVDGKVLGEGVGRSKSKAEMNAAAAALDRLRVESSAIPESS